MTSFSSFPAISSTGWIFSDIIEKHLATKADVTLATVPFPVSKVEGLGLTRVNDDLSIAQFVEKPKDPAIIASLALSSAIEATLKTPSEEKRCLASMGIYVFNRDVLADALDNNMADFGKEVIPGLLGKKKLYLVYLRRILGRYRDR